MGVVYGWEWGVSSDRGSSGEANTRSLPSILPRRDGKNLIIQLLKISLLAELHLHEGGRKGWGGVGGSSGETT